MSVNWQSDLFGSSTNNNNDNNNNITTAATAPSSSLYSNGEAAFTSARETINSGAASVGGYFSAMMASTSVTSKAGFIIVVLVGLYLLVYITLFLIGYFRLTSQAPWLISGTLPGSTAVTITQHPYQNPSQFIARSNDDPSGLSFTYSWWMQISPQAVNANYYCVFVKGMPSETSGAVALRNGPGVYVKNNTTDNDVSLMVYMDQEKDNDNNTSTYIEVQHMPLRKWVHLALRMQNTALDVYVNGMLAKRHVFTTVPKQNDLDFFVNPQGGFGGSLSNLRYYPQALSIFTINYLVMSGPNTQPSSYAPQTSVAGTSMDYLSYGWFTAQS